MHPLARLLCRTSWIPLTLRRSFGKLLVPYSSRNYTLSLDGRPYRGTLDNYIEWVTFVTGAYYEYTYLNLIRAFDLGGCVLDIGANVGNHASAFATMFDEVLAFEPFPPVYDRLSRKTADLEAVHVFNLGLGAEEGDLRFAPPADRNLGTGRVTSGGPLTIPVMRGDRFLEGRDTAPIRLVKIDVEGHEAEVLRGLEGTLAHHRPVVLFEAPRAFGRDGPPLSEGLGLFPEGYAFWGLRGQSTFPFQRSVARPVPIVARNEHRRYASVLALPVERGLLPLTRAARRRGAAGG